ncbi:MAG TPA: endopeptidase La, partial [Candidatus Tectomicrobia bacterium]|nr:endopeptidase La [Candidatus Tectomicrobia bacterium]
DNTAYSPDYTFEQRLEILKTFDVAERLRKVYGFLTKQLELMQLRARLQEEVKTSVDRSQREYILREQLKAIRKELGETDAEQALQEELRQKIEQAGMPEAVKERALRELRRLEQVGSHQAEASVIRTYLEWLTDLPWSKRTEDHIDLAEARRVLDEDHYGLQKVKERILEYMAVRKLAGERMRSPILCFVGPPGVGKTSLGQSIARALAREFVRMSLGGVRDEAEIRGHRRTYIGAMPGRIIQAIRRAETRDPVFMLDEIDKVGSDWRGDPSAALLEVLDPAQNHAFVDTYLGVPFDLSQVLFIATANTLDTIPPALRDRMEVLQLSGYTDEEKVRIAERYLVPKQRAAHGLRAEEVTFDADALARIVRAYTRDAGVRSLEREVATIVRKVARRIAEGEPGPVHVTAEQVAGYLGRPRFFDDPAERTDRPGVATGLAWTPAGGEVLFVEATMMPSREEQLVLTGMLGDVMRESAQAALSWVRSNAERLGIGPELFEGKTIHVHVPAGAIPKDGPSAGVAMAAAVASLATGRPVRGDVAMTGEITLRGKVLPVGGIKEKVLAAHRSGVRRVILPRRNEGDLDDVPAPLREQMTFALVDTVMQALAEALEPSVSARRSAA